MTREGPGRRRAVQPPRSPPPLRAHPSRSTAPIPGSRTSVLVRKAHCITGLRTARLIHLSRRSLLAGLGIGTVALLAATTPASWAASGVTAGLTPDPETIDVATTDGTTVAVPVLLGGILTVSGGGLPAGTRIAVTWASALYAVEAAF